MMFHKKINVIKIKLIQIDIKYLLKIFEIQYKNIETYRKKSYYFQFIVKSMRPGVKE